MAWMTTILLHLFSRMYRCVFSSRLRVVISEVLLELKNTLVKLTAISCMIESRRMRLETALYYYLAPQFYQVKL